MDVRVFKFGGSSLNEAKTIAKAAGIIQTHSSGLVVVVSAMGGMTDLLLKAGDEAARGNLGQLEAYAGEFSDRHLKAIYELIPDGSLRKDLVAIVNAASAELRAICASLDTLREFTTKTMARTVARGERVMAQLMSFVLLERGAKAMYVDASEILKVSKGPLGMAPDQKVSETLVRERLLPLVKAGTIPIVPGFIASGPEGDVVTLGRGGSDYTAAIIGSFLDAKAVTLYKEVDGLLTADPRHVSEARIVPELHYREAAELSYYGAKVLHPRSIIPLIRKQIPLTIKNTFRPEQPGTRIAGDVGAGEYPVKALTAIMDQALVAVEGSGMIGVPGVAERTFKAMSDAKISVTMISQASSEASICFTVPTTEAKLAEEALVTEFRYELEHEFIDRVKVLPMMAIVAIVGLGMSGTRGIAARAFGALARSEVNIVAIAQGSSELNISVVVAMEDAKSAVAVLHREYRLDKIRAMHNGRGGEVNLVLTGLGQIGRTLAEQLMSQGPYFREKLGITTRVIGLADSSGLIVKEKGFDKESLRHLVSAKSRGQKILQVPDAARAKNFDDIRQQFKARLWHLAMVRGIFVDLTADETAPLIRDALNEGLHVVVANKKPLAVPYKDYLEFFELAQKHKRMLRYEATVGAGLPILDTLAKLEAAGDDVIRIEGCLSGTLGFLMSALEDGMTFQNAVRTAFERGYTEPDPREDLSGMDVARKALILARTLRIPVDMKDVILTPLFPQSVSRDNPQEFIDGLKSLDAEYGEKVAAAARDGKCLRYVASIAASGVKVGIEAVHRDSPMGRLRGTANQVNIQSKRYRDNPLIVTGPGAGADVTAAGVLNDIVAIATADLPP